MAMIIINVNKLKVNSNGDNRENNIFPKFAVSAMN